MDGGGVRAPGHGIPGGEPKFGAPVTDIDHLFRMAPGAEVRVRGRVRSHQVGTALTLADDTGQVEVRSMQTRRLPPGTQAEAVGRVRLEGSRWIVDGALYRPVGALAPEGDTVHENPQGILTTVAQVKAIGATEAERGRSTEGDGHLVERAVGLHLPAGPDRRHPGPLRPFQTGFFKFVKYLEVKGVTRSGPSPPP